MWKFHGFSITQILREINFGEKRSAKYAILTHLGALNFDFCGILHFLKVEMYQINKIYSPKKWPKWKFLDFLFLQNWFHVKSKWQKNPEISTPWSMYRVKIFSKKLISRNFRDKTVAATFTTFFDKSFVKPTVLLNKLLKCWFHEIFFRWERISKISTVCIYVWVARSLYTVVYSHQKIFRQINSLVTYLAKPLVSRNFCQKSVIENFRNFHTVSVVLYVCTWKTKNLLSSSPKEYFVNSII